MKQNKEKEEYLPKVIIDGCTFEESGYQRGNYYWKASTLYLNAVKPTGL